MTGKALICKLGEIQDIEGADRIGRVELFGETLVVSKDHEEGELGILFDCETQLSHEYCHYNNLYRHSHLNEDPTKSGYIEDNRRVKPVRLKGVKCSGFWMPIDSLKNVLSTSHKVEHSVINTIEEGFQFNKIGGIEICEKYIPPKTRSASKKNKEGKARKKDLVPTFKEHFDTDYWARNSHKLKVGDLVYITEKLHGTSFRCGNMLTIQELSPFQKVWNSLVPNKIKPKQEYHFVVGSRRVVKSIEGEEAENKDHYYGHDLWTEVCTREFKGKLNKGETVYGEIVGYDMNGSPIMGTHSNEKLKPFLDKKDYKEFINKYGNTTRFHYGTFEMIHDGDRTTTNKENKVFVYRITQTNADGDTIDLSWEQVKSRCEQLNVDHVPELKKYLIEDSTDIKLLNQEVDVFTQLDSKNFPEHINEGVCVRIENERLVPQIYKNKRWEFKVLEGIIKDSNELDIEEAN